MYDPNLGYDPTVWNPETHPLPPGYRVLRHGERLPANTHYIVFNPDDYDYFASEAHPLFRVDPKHPGWLVSPTGYPNAIIIGSDPEEDGLSPFAVPDDGIIRHEDD